MKRKIEGAIEKSGTMNVRVKEISKDTFSIQLTRNNHMDATNSETNKRKCENNDGNNNNNNNLNDTEISWNETYFELDEVTSQHTTQQNILHACKIVVNLFGSLFFTPRSSVRSSPYIHIRQLVSLSLYYALFFPIHM